MKMKLVMSAILAVGIGASLIATNLIGSREVQAGCHCGMYECCITSFKALLKSADVKTKDRIIDTLIFLLSEKVDMKEITEVVEKAVLNPEQSLDVITGYECDGECSPHPPTK